MHKLSNIFCLLIISVFISCTSNEIGNSSDVNTDAIYFDYLVKAGDDRDYVTIRLQYRMGGPNGTTLVISDPGKVMLDDEELVVDSAGFSGAYYETQRNLAGFSGKHTISFFDLNGKEFREEFEFLPFRLSPDIDAVVQRKDIVFRFEGLKDDADLDVVMMDTSFTSRDINDKFRISNGELVVSQNRLQALVDGPINLHISKEQKIPVKNGTQQGGMLRINYELNRNFELRTS